MTYQVLARKWRPKSFGDVVGQPHIIRSLQNVIKEGCPGHAYLFTGTRGVGKTSVARIFTKALRCSYLTKEGNPCCECTSCLEIDNGTSMDVQELDGASHNKVDTIRELTETVPYLPTSGRFKVYIIDEVHMLSTSAFNALLKTLEEPPAHVIFILATTEPHKVLSTVLSRCQRFDFKHVTLNDLIKHVESLSKVEDIHFESPILIEKLCQQGQGSIRDTMSLLDQALSFSIDRNISEETIVMALGLVRTSTLKDIFECVLLGEVEKFSKLFSQMMIENVSINKFCLSLLEHIQSAIKLRQSEGISEYVDPQILAEFRVEELFWIYENLSKDFQWGLQSLSSQNTIELIIQKMAYRRTFFKKKTEKLVEDKVEYTIEKKVEDKIQEKVQDKIEMGLEPIKEHKVLMNDEIISVAPEIEIVEVDKDFIRPEPILSNDCSKGWSSFLDYVRSVSPVTSSNLEQGNILSGPDFKDGQLFLNIGFAKSGQIFHEYLCVPEVSERIKKYLADYFEIQSQQVVLSFLLVSEGVGDKNEFLSIAEEKDKQAFQDRLDREKEMRLDPLINYAQEIFGAKVDKIVLNN